MTSQTRRPVNNDETKTTPTTTNNNHDNTWLLLSLYYFYYAAVLYKPHNGFSPVRPSVRPSVCPSRRAPNSETEMCSNILWLCRIANTQQIEASGVCALTYEGNTRGHTKWRHWYRPQFYRVWSGFSPAPHVAAYLALNGRVYTFSRPYIKFTLSMRIGEAARVNGV